VQKAVVHKELTLDIQKKFGEDQQLMTGLFVTLLFLCLLLDVASSQTYYKRLGVKPTATEKEIKKAYRKMAMKVRSISNDIINSILTYV